MMCQTVLQQRDGTLTNPWKAMEKPWKIHGFLRILGQVSPIIINYLLGYRGWDPRKRWRPPSWSWNVIGRSCKGRRKRCSSGEIPETDQKPVALQTQNGYSTAFIPRHLVWFWHVLDALHASHLFSTFNLSCVQAEVKVTEMDQKAQATGIWSQEVRSKCIRWPWWNG